jgi:peptidylprolyl isomerase
MAQVTQGDRVRVFYTGMLEDGIIFDSSENVDSDNGGSGPLEFVIGEGSVIPGFEAAVIGMTAGEEKRVVIPMVEAYGPHLAELVAEVSRSNLPEGMDPKKGESLEVVPEGGQPIAVIVVDATPEKIILDANHPLSGRDLTFDIRLDAILK